MVYEEIFSLIHTRVSSNRKRFGNELYWNSSVFSLPTELHAICRYVIAAAKEPVFKTFLEAFKFGITSTIHCVCYRKDWVFFHFHGQKSIKTNRNSEH